MTGPALHDHVRRLRAAGMSPGEIAKAPGVRKAAIAPIVRRLAAQRPAQPPEQGDLVGCWVSPAWSRELLVQRREGWDDVDLGADGPAGIALVLIGVKNAIGPERMHRRDLRGILQSYFAAFRGAPLRAPLSLAQHLVHGAVAFAAGLGFDPHPDFAGARGYLPELDEPCAIEFGRYGRSAYFAGPHDDPAAVMRTLREWLGDDGLAVAA